jgi:hypothetical protein
MKLSHRRFGCKETIRMENTTERTGRTSSEFLEAGMDYRLDILKLFIFLFEYILPPIVATMGVIGNVLSYFLMSKQKYGSSTTCFYMRCLAVGDSLYIIDRIVLRYLLIIFPAILEDLKVKRSYCLTYLSGYFFVAPLSPCILVGMTVDRVIALTWPLKARTLSTLKRARISFAIMVTFSATWCSVNVLRREQKKYKMWLCPYHFDENIDFIYDMSATVIFIYIPMVLLTFLNFRIIWTIFHQKRARVSLTKSRVSSAQERSITKMTLLVTFGYVGFCLPIRIHMAFWQHWTGEATLYYLYMQRLFLDVTIFFDNLNYALNSYMYSLGCRRFRQELKDMLKDFFHKWFHQAELNF